jgi:hypothetical protein
MGKGRRRLCSEFAAGEGRATILRADIRRSSRAGQAMAREKSSRGPLAVYWRLPLSFASCDYPPPSGSAVYRDLGHCVSRGSATSEASAIGDSAIRRQPNANRPSISEKLNALACAHFGLTRATTSALITYVAPPGDRVHS